MRFLKLTAARDGATMYVRRKKIAAVVRHEPTVALPVHTVLFLEGNRTVGVLERPADIIERPELYAVTGPAPSPTAEPEPGVSPR